MTSGIYKIMYLVNFMVGLYTQDIELARINGGAYNRNLQQICKEEILRFNKSDFL